MENILTCHISYTPKYIRVRIMTDSGETVYKEKHRTLPIGYKNACEYFRVCMKKAVF
jgi:hypothetical protein